MTPTRIFKPLRLACRGAFLVSYKVLGCYLLLLPCHKVSLSAACSHFVTDAVHWTSTKTCETASYVSLSRVVSSINCLNFAQTSAKNSSGSFEFTNRKFSAEMASSRYSGSMISWTLFFCSWGIASYSDLKELNYSTSIHSRPSLGEVNPRTRLWITVSLTPIWTFLFIFLIIIEIKYFSLNNFFNQS